MSLISAATALAFVTALTLFLIGFFRLADALGASDVRPEEIAISSAEIAGAILIWLFSLGVIGGII